MFSNSLGPQPTDLQGSTPKQAENLFESSSHVDGGYRDFHGFSTFGARWSLENRKIKFSVQPLIFRTKTDKISKKNRDRFLEFFGKVVPLLTLNNYGATVVMI